MIRSFLYPLARIWQNRSFIRELSRRELTDQHAGQMLGFLWIIINPLIIILIYIFIFGFVFKSRIAISGSMPENYTRYILSGLIPWITCQMTMLGATTALTGEAGLVKQVVFPIEVLPVKKVVVGFYSQFMSFILFFIWIVLTKEMISWMLILLPVLIALQFLMLVGLAFFLSIITAFFRDMKDLMSLFVMVGVYLMPVLYPPQWLPEGIRGFLNINPFSHIVWCFQDILYHGMFRHPLSWWLFGFGSLAVFVLGFKLFQKVRFQLGNVL